MERQLPILNELEEIHFTKWITDCSAIGIPKTKTEIKKAAAKICTYYVKRKINGKLFKNNLPPEKWFISFFISHSEIRLRVPEFLGRASANVSKTNLRNWFIFLNKRAKIVYIVEASNPK